MLRSTTAAVVAHATAQSFTVESIQAAVKKMKEVLDSRPVEYPEVWLFTSEEWVHFQLHVPMSKVEDTTMSFSPVGMFKSWPDGIPVYVSYTSREHKELLFDLSVLKRKRVGMMRDGVAVMIFPAPLSEDARARECQPL